MFKKQITPALLWPKNVFQNECLAPPGLTAVNTVAQVAELSPWARTTPESSFCQQRIHGNPILNKKNKGQREHGRFLRFPNKNHQSNVIRAGGAGRRKRTRGSHSDAILGILEFDRFVASIASDSVGAQLGWIGSIKTPNLVCHGRFKTLISESLGKDHRVTHTGKFPGYAVHVADDVIAATAEVFLNGRIVLPGMKSPDGLRRALTLICEVVKPHMTTTPTDTVEDCEDGAGGLDDGPETKGLNKGAQASSPEDAMA